VITSKDRKLHSYFERVAWLSCEILMSESEDWRALCDGQSFSNTAGSCCSFTQDL